ncbi:uncharacterized protein LOC133182124 [Saccostrea echinata]|uniref:uncharacterized protein LOC133182124 n=1 Tax=Saccostrea echinata TaxID=191078 RepID=UPI002A7FB6AD|nr:uncharacterized protein LOC133182124 [Saccostrea echinata]
MSSKSEIIEKLKEAVTNARTDILRSIISAVEKDKDLYSPTLLRDILNEVCCEEGTLLHLSSKLGNVDIIRTLLSANADPGIHNEAGKTAYDLVDDENVRMVFSEELLQATAQSKLGRVCQLFASGIDVNLIDSEESQNTPLHWAASFGNRAVIQCLCTRGADVRAVNANGCTPLHDAVKRGDAQAVTELLMHNSDPMAKVTCGKDEGKTAIDLAAGKPQVLKVLTNPPKPLHETDHTAGTQSGLQKLTIRADSASDTSLQSPVPNGDVNGPLSPTPQLKTPTFTKNISLDSTLQPPKPVVTEEKLGLLWPQPQSIIQRDGKPFTLDYQLPVFVSTGPNESSKDVLKIWQTRKSAFEMLSLHVTVEVFTLLSNNSVPHIMCCVNSRVCPGCALYKLTISSNQVKIVCSDVPSLHYAIATVFQLFSLYKDEKIHVPPLLIDDWPDIHYRGILLDISQGRLLMKNSLKYVIDSLSLNKINMIQLYCRFTKKDEPGWQAPYSKSCICDLDSYCSDRGIQVVPVLDVVPQIQFEDLDDLYSTLQDFIATFQYAQFVSLGPRLSSFVLDADDGSLDTSDSIKLLPLQGDRTIQICGYPLHGLDTKLLFDIPPNVLISEYGIEADYEFRRFCTPLSEKGVGFFLCPGTSAWNSIAGCPEAAIKNIYNAVKCGVTHGCTGIVACDWSGKGHLNSHLFSWPAYMLTSGLSWNSNCHQDFLFANLGELMNQHMFCDKKSIAGQVIVELGRAETYLIRCSRAQTAGDTQRLPDALGSTLFKFLMAPDTVSIEHLSIEAVQRTVRHVKKCQQELNNADLQCLDREEIIAEINMACELMLLATRICRSLLITGKNPSGTAGYAAINLGINNLTATVKTDIANRILEVMEPYKAAWNSRYMSSIGLQESLGIFQSLLRTLLPNEDTTELMNRGHIHHV